MAKKIFAFVFIGFAHLHAQNFTIPLTVNGNEVKIGVHPLGTDSFDVGLDIFAPPQPPPGSFDVRLKWKMEEYLTDIRSNAIKLDTFRLAYRRAASESIIVRWDKTRLPALVDTIYITDDFGVNQFHLDMKTLDSLDVAVSPLLRDQLRIVFKPKLRVGVDDRSDLNELPNDFNLMQNHPNPFNPQTTIRFAVPKAGHVVLDIFDIQGRLIRTLASGYFEAGVHAVAWNGRNQNGHAVASGVYLYVLKAGDLMAQRRLLLIK